ncbi:MAG: hypothetical protein ABJA98_18090 [Acidobacteriota bacterium]
MADEFGRRGVGVILASSDMRERAEEAKAIWSLQHLNVDYGLAIDHACRWRLFISTTRGQTGPGVEEPALFSEPGLFLVRPGGTLYWSSIPTMPSARPHVTEILTSLDFAIKNHYPACGEACEGRR